MKVFYFTSAKWGLDNIKRARLKVSDFSNVNDPFELLGIEMRDKNVRRAMEFEKSKISKNSGLVCFSENKYDPVQWAHYADNHRGICLGFDIPDKRLRKVRYVSERLAKSTLEDPDKTEKLLTTKFRHWSYEMEHRLIIDLRNYQPDSKGLRFEDFSDDLELREIYIGCHSDLAFDDVISSLRSNKGNIVTKYTRPSFKDFRIVWDQRKKSIRQ